MNRKHTLLFVHGIYHGAWCFEEHFIPYFSGKGYSASAINLLGNDPETMIKEILDACSELDSTPILIGHSLGARLIQALIPDHSFPGAILMNPPTLAAILRKSVGLIFSHPKKIIKTLFRWNIQEIYHSPELVDALFFSGQLPKAEFEMYLSKIQKVSYPMKSMIAFSRIKTSSPPSQKTPVLVLAGEKDSACTPERLKSVADLYRTQVTVVPDAPHDLMLGKNWEEAAKLILSWLEARERN